MPSNRLVHKLLIGRKRKVQATDTTRRSNYNNDGNGHLLSSSPRSEPMSKQLQASTIFRRQYQPTRGNDIITSTPECSTQTLQRTFADHNTHRLQDLPKLRQKHGNEEKCQLRHRLKHRSLHEMKRKQRRRKHNYDRGADLNMDINGNDNVDHQQLRRLENFAATRQQRRQQSKNALFANTFPATSKLAYNSLAESLIRTFLEQRYKGRDISRLTVSCFNPFDDPMLFPVLLLGICALFRLVASYEQQQDEVSFTQSPIVRDLVLWMNDRQELNTACTSETTMQKSLDALNQLAKFHKSIEDSHQLSIRLSSRQREEEGNTQESYNHKKNYRDFHYGIPEKLETKIDKNHCRMNKKQKMVKEGTDSHQSTNTTNNLFTDPRQQKIQDQYYQNLEAKNVPIDANHGTNNSFNSSTKGEEPQQLSESVALRTSNNSHNASDFFVDNTIGDKAHSLPNLSVSTQSPISVPSDDTDRRLKKTRDFNVAMSSTDAVTKYAGPSITNPRSPKFSVVREKDQQPNRFRSDSCAKKIQGERDTNKSPEKSFNTTDVDDIANCSSPLPKNCSEDTYCSPVMVPVKVLTETLKTKNITVDVTAARVSGVGLSERINDLTNLAKSTVLKEAARHDDTNGVVKTKHKQDRTIRPVDAARPVANDRVSDSQPSLQPDLKRSNMIASNANSAVEKRASISRTGQESDSDSNSEGGSSYISSDDLSQVLLSQSPKPLLKSRRVTASPCVLSDIKARRLREGYKHFSMVNFSGQNQNTLATRDFASDCPLGRKKGSKRDNRVKQSSQRTWMSRAGKRSPSFKQTSLTSSSGWISNQRARDFVKSKWSPKAPAMEVASPASCNFGIGNSDKSNKSALIDDHKVGNNTGCKEVVRGKSAREVMPGNECKECAAFFDEAVLRGDGANYYDRDELLRCTRHRSHHTPPQTPEDYWELSFLDEKKKRLQQEE